MTRDTDAVARFEVLHQVAGEHTAGRRQRRVQLLRRHVQVVDVVVLEMEEVAHLLVWSGAREGLVAGEAVVQHGELLAHLAVGMMQAHHGMGEIGGALAYRLEVLQARPVSGKDRIGEDLAEGRDEPVVVVDGDLRKIEPELFRKAEQNRRGNGPLVVLQLVHVAGRQPQPLGEIALGQLCGGAQGADLAAMKSFFTRVVRLGAVCKFANSSLQID